MDTKQTEIRLTTSTPREMLHQYLATRVSKIWVEDFIDEDNGETCSIERSETIFEKGTLIDQDILAQIRLYIAAGDIQEVEVSNQKRMAYELQNTTLHPYISQIETGGRKHKFIFYANSINSALSLLKDYIELHYQSGFIVLMIKEFDSCIILEDNLKEIKPDTLPEDWQTADLGVEEQAPDKKKFYQMDIKIIYNEEEEDLRTFVVHTLNVDRAMMIINHYIRIKQEENESKALSRGQRYEKQTITTMIETAKLLPVGTFIPMDFSTAYND